MILRTILLALLLGVVPMTLAQGNNYPLTPDSQAKEGVPRGVVTKYTYTAPDAKGAPTNFFPGTVRDCYVYVPAQYKPGDAAALMVFQDGGGYQSRDGQWRVPVVFDNLIAAGDMPVTIAVMVNPGVLPARDEAAQLPRFNRSIEYDGVNARYADFLAMELLPQVERTAGVRFTKDPNLRAIGGASSGGAAAFTAAWHRPNLFAKVFCTIGSFTDLRGAHNYPTWVRKYERKPIRVFLQDGSNDLDIYSGSWWRANQDLAKSLGWAGYDFRFITGDGGHDGRQGGQVFPDALRFLFRGWKENGSKPDVKPTRQVGATLVADGAAWERVGADLRGFRSVTADKSGQILVNLSNGERVMRLDTETGKATVFRAGPRRADLLVYGPNEKLYALSSDRRAIFVWEESGSETVVARDVRGDSFTITANGEPIFATAGGIARQMGNTKLVTPVQPLSARPILSLTPDQSLLLVAPSTERGKFVGSWSVAANGVLSNGQDYHDLQIEYGQNAPYASAMTHDTNGWLYVATGAGIQVLDQAGRVNAILSKPNELPLRAMAWGGANRDWLYVLAGGDRLYRRKMRARGLNPCDAPMKPPAPRL